ncbi:MAG: hypothetical protein AAGD25_16035 [Cyanobacteria bacterium P01_F01_bin.150]
MSCLQDFREILSEGESVYAFTCIKPTFYLNDWPSKKDFMPVISNICSQEKNQVFPSGENWENILEREEVNSLHKPSFRDIVWERRKNKRYPD